MEPESLYHIYNRGNNSQTIFFKREDYLVFLQKIGKHLSSHLDVLAYCLMPNHFHFLAHSRDDLDLLKYQHDFRIMLSSYTRKINFRTGRTGSLFQQNSKAKLLTDKNHPFICFHYIHQNPLRAKLASRLEDWEFSSYRDYAGLRAGTLINKETAHQLLDLPIGQEAFIEQSKMVIDPSKTRDFLF